MSTSNKFTARQQLLILLLIIATHQVAPTQQAKSSPLAADRYESLEDDRKLAPRDLRVKEASDLFATVESNSTVKRQNERLDETAAAAADSTNTINTGTAAAGQTNSSQQQQGVRSFSSELSRWLATRDLWGLNMNSSNSTNEPGANGSSSSIGNQTKTALPMVVQVTAIHVDKSEFPLSKLLFKLTLKLALAEANKYLEQLHQQQQQQQQLQQSKQQQQQRRRVRLSLSIRSANTCSRQYAAALAAEEYYVRKSRMFLVSGCDDAIRDVSRLASQWQVPIMTAAGFGVDLDDKVLHSTLIRVAFSMRAAVEFLFKIMKSFQWRRVNLVVDESDTNSFALKGSIEQHALKYKTKDSRIDLNTISIDLKKLMRHGDVEEYQQQQQLRQQASAVDGSDQMGVESLFSNVTTTIKTGPVSEQPQAGATDGPVDDGDDDHWPSAITDKVIRDTLWQCSMNSRVTILLIPQHLVRRFMLSAYDQNMANGLYTFVNMPLLLLANDDQTDSGQAVGSSAPSTSAPGKQQMQQSPLRKRQRKDSYTFSTGENVFIWRSLRSRSRNAHAKQAFESLMSIYLKTPTTKAYIYFASKLNTLANSRSRAAAAAAVATTTIAPATTPIFRNSSTLVGSTSSLKPASGDSRPRATTASPSSSAATASSHEPVTAGKKVQLNINPYSASFYDSLQIYAAALMESLNLLTKEYQTAPKSVSNSSSATAAAVASQPLMRPVKRRLDGVKLHAKISELVRSRRFDNMITGNIYINQNGDRETDYTLDDMNQMTGKFAPVIMYRGETRDIERLGRIHWSSDASVGPTSDTVDCTLNGTCVSKPMTRFTLVLILLAGPLVFILSGVFYFVHNKLSLESQLVDHWWRIHLSEIELPGKLSGNHQLGGTGVGGGGSSRRSGAGSTIGIGSAGGVRTEITKATSGGWASSAQDACYGNITLGIYKLSKVALKPIGKFHQSRKLTIELRSLKDINHNNLCRFVGILVDEGSLAIVSEFCPKGSLREFFHNESMVIDWTFKYSIINDIMTGLLYLHSSPLAFHGRLKSSNCLVSARFVVKLSDYGPHSLYEQLDDDDFGAYADEHGNKDAGSNSGHERLANWLKNRIWLAPEHMKSSSRVGSMKGDVYSLGLLLYEIITNCSPFFSTEKDDFVLPLRALYKELKRNGASELMEPSVKAIETEVDETNIGPLVELMQTCWRFEASKRPTSVVVSAALKKITRGVTSKKLLENLTLRMEQYTNNLESLVDAKLAVLVEEKFKAEELLYQFVPKSIASLLKEGQFVEPEAFECVTVFYSDIVGFTSLSSESSPMEVIDFLSDLYLCFDSTLEQHDIFKVDTIGDAYIVASGLPKRNEGKHVIEIACAALELRERVRCFKIPHKPEHSLEMRVGIHSGPCIAGIVGGLNMPKYCVFGDTLTIGNFMESSGLPMKIHITEESKNLLHGVSGFSIEPRTPKIMRDGLPYQTYWLETAAE